ncbi:unnamed protein product [Paramecium sonneborni]|uniref:Uncharacterized protein n=1 Tax=Paramecium sonneborni TaxID=65129 RepID=A0A8S1KXI1_9CILI|nr:unnamed protein product [Paramecium sonneborni]
MIILKLKEKSIQKRNKRYLIKNINKFLIINEGKPEGTELISEQVMHEHKTKLYINYQDGRLKFSSHFEL